MTLTERTNDVLAKLREIAECKGVTDGPWTFERGGGHSYNRIVGKESVQTNGWEGRVNGVSNASYTDRICENLGDPELPHPSATIAFIARSRTITPAMAKALDEEIQRNHRLSKLAFKWASDAQTMDALASGCDAVSSAECKERARTLRECAAAVEIELAGGKQNFKTLEESL